MINLHHLPFRASQTIGTSVECTKSVACSVSHVLRTLNQITKEYKTDGLD